MKNKLFEKYFVFSPYFWLVLFFFIPLAIIFKISISVSEWGMPPYQDIFLFDNGFKINTTFENYVYIFSDYYYIGSFVNSLILALISTFFCLLIGFPLAFYIATSNIRLRNILLVLVVIPFWSSFLLRVYAWKIILQNNGILNVILLNLGITSEPLQLLYNQYAVIMGIVYTYLPLMILPLYGYLNKFDLNLIEASKDLGLNRIKTFFKVILPLSVPGIVAGSLLVFIPVVGEFIIPEMLGGSDRLYYGKILWEEFFVNRNWPGASALAFSGIIILVLIFYSFNENKRVMVWKGFSLRWYNELFNNEQIIEAFIISIKIAALSATFATILGVMIGYSLVRIRKIPFKSFYIFLSSTPLVLPELILGLSMLLFFISLNNVIGFPSSRGQLTIFISHVTFCIAFVAIIIQARLTDFNKNIEEAAMDLGYNYTKVLYKITLPIILPSIIAGWLLAFTISLDDLVVASFTTGPGANTLPIVVFSKVRLGLSPEVNALSAILMFALIIIGLFYFYFNKKFKH